MNPTVIPHYTQLQQVEGVIAITLWLGASALFTLLLLIGCRYAFGKLQPARFIKRRWR